mgnify:CR=1 FL=1
MHTLLDQNNLENAILHLVLIFQFVVWRLHSGTGFRTSLLLRNMMQ